MGTTMQKAERERTSKKAVAAFASTGSSSARPSKSRHPISAAVKKELDADGFAFPKQRKEPLTDARHVCNAIARFAQVEDVSDSERDAAWRRIRTVAKKYDLRSAPGDGASYLRGGRPGGRELLNPRSPLADTSEASP